MWVVKLGGSLLDSPELKIWLEIVAQHGDGQVVIVPGGGLFADAVRVAQQKVKVSAKAAHHLAVLAMNQYAHFLIDLQPDLVLADSELALAESSWQHRGIVWLPSAMVLTDTTIPQSWDVTSDSLAAWLAKKMEAKKLILIKSALPMEANLATMVQQGLVDSALPDFINGQSFETWVVNKADYMGFMQGFTEQALLDVGHKVHTK